MELISANLYVIKVSGILFFEVPSLRGEEKKQREVSV